jgi:hypothetical protein
VLHWGYSAALGLHRGYSACKEQGSQVFTSKNLPMRMHAASLRCSLCASTASQDLHVRHAALMRAERVLEVSSMPWAPP